MDYHLRLGRLHQYNIPEINPERAIEDFRHAAESTSSASQLVPLFRLRARALLIHAGSARGNDVEHPAREEEELVPLLADERSPGTSYVVEEQGARMQTWG